MFRIPKTPPKEPTIKITKCPPRYAFGYVPENSICLPEYQLVCDSFKRQNKDK